jgi:ABC-type nitrate/sulfonate/bicarbonate transport system substrate-binding protein
MRFVYLAIVLYLAAHLAWMLAREKSFWKQAGIALVLILFILRLFLIQ